MADIQTEILERLVRLETKIDDYNRLRDKVDLTHTLATTAHNLAIDNEKDISEIKSNQRWLWRTIAGALILAAIAAFVKFSV
jgi:ribonuclease HIII